MDQFLALFSFEFWSFGVLRVRTLEFLHHFTKNSRTKIDIEFHELGLMLNAKNEHVVKVGMVFKFSLRFQNYAKDVVICTLQLDSHVQSITF